MRILRNQLSSSSSWRSGLWFLSIGILSSLLVGSALGGCVLGGNDEQKPANTVAWLNSGELSFGGPLPQAVSAGQEMGKASASNTQESNYNDFAYGFSPTSTKGSRSLVLNTSQKMAKLFQSGKEIASAKLLDTSSLVVGSYQVAHKQRNPLWYAPKEYFSSRGLSVPSEGDKQRYLRGAFGDFALFVSPTEAIHSGPFSLSELSGARIEEQDFAKIFYLVEIGDSIKIE